ncbi:MAG: carboxypeptidase-like regulatory domain-containing protein, partial [Planctomycetes bacterium]|nr:carboxypeptidase-like regulatory domain-containing protein [Planctomycetota bacterium]
PPQDQWYRNWVDAALGWRYDRQMICGQGNYLNPKADSVTQLQYSVTAGADGTSNYSYYETADENMNGNSEHDTSWFGYVATNLFTTAVATPAMPWRDPALADEGTLWGRIMNGTTGEPIDGATVTVGALDAVETDGNGYYVVTLIPASTGGSQYNVTADSLECAPVTTSHVTIMPGNVVWRDFELCPLWGGPGDMDEDGDIDYYDLNLLMFCTQGPDSFYTGGHFCLNGDADTDQDIDLADFANFQREYTGP